MLLLELARNEATAQRAQQELRNVELLEVQTANDITDEKLQRLHYVRGIVREVLRLAPPIDGGFREACQTIELHVSSDLPLIFS